MRKNIVEPDMQRMAVWRIMNTYGYKYTLRICNTYCFSTATKVAQMRPNVMLCVNCLFCLSVSPYRGLCVCKSLPCGQSFSVVSMTPDLYFRPLIKARMSQYIDMFTRKCYFFYTDSDACILVSTVLTSC